MFFWVMCSAVPDQSMILPKPLSKKIALKSIRPISAAVP
jgi:hypothetical protein